MVQLSNMKDKAMADFRIHDVSTAPERSREILDAILDGKGFIPNVFGLIAEAPVVLEGIAAVNMCFDKTSFTPAEREVIALATSVENQCGYCVAGHSTFALKHGVSPADVAQIRSGARADDPRLEALRAFTTSLVRKKGLVSEADIEVFLLAGFKEAQILELLLGIIAKVMTNFASKLAHVPVDTEFAEHKWEPETKQIDNHKAA